MNVDSERTKSLWMETEATPERPRLEGNLRCDTVIVAAGIAGRSTAYQLASAGRVVIVIDRGPAVRGMTARTTALGPGEGGVISKGKSKVAVCRELNGTLHRRSAVCSRLGCVVHWNSTEQCWDCPRHGSQFAPDGAVLNAPAIKPLAPAERTSQEKKATTET